MVNKEQIEQWLRDGTISQDQASKMLTDALVYKKEQSSNKFIVVISTIGSILLGIGAILFVASNWSVMSDFLKTIILIVSTFGAYYIGYIFKYQKQNLPKAGASLIFLGALLFGATIFLLAQMYNINANSHSLILIWLIGILPFVYAFQSSSIAGLASFIFFLWIGFFVMRNIDFSGTEGDFFRLPALYLISGVLLFAVGQLHYLFEKLTKVARVYRLVALKVVMLSLFFLTFKIFSGFGSDRFFAPENYETSEQFTFGFILFSIIAILLTLINFFRNPSKSVTNSLENSLALVLAGVTLVFFLFPGVSNFYVIVFNLILAGLVFVLLWLGYEREDIQIVNAGMFWLGALIVVRYFDFFWSLLPRSLFFLLGGLILIVGGIMLEKRRRKIKEQFKNIQTQE